MFSIDEAREHEREGPCDAGRGSKREREEPRVSDAGASANASRATSDASASANASRATSGASASANARSHACQTQVRARRVRPCDVGRGRKAFYSWNSAMAAKGSQNTKITTNGQRWALLTATYSRMNAVGQK